MITPLPGWKIDPNNPNGVIQDGPPINLGSTAFGAVNSPYPAQSSNIRDLQIRGGDPASIVQSSGTQAQGVAQGSAPQFDGNALIQLLQSYQKKALTRGFNAQEAQIAAGQQTPDELIGASPGLQNSVRSAQEASFNPTIEGANSVDVALRDQVSNIRQLLTQQQTIADKARDDARAVIKDAFTLGGADSMKDLDPTEIAALEKSAGYPKGYIAGLAQTMKERELELKRQINEQNNLTRLSLKGKGGGGAADAATYEVERANRVIGAVDEAIAQIGNWNVGFAGGVLRGVPGSSAYDLDRAVDQIKANIGFQELQAMRAASPTGGALGQVAVQELNMLQAVLGSLDTAQSAEQLKKNLEDIKLHYTNWLNVMQQANGGVTGASTAPTTASAGKTSSGNTYTVTKTP